MKLIKTFWIVGLYMVVTNIYHMIMAYVEVKFARTVNCSINPFVYSYI